MATFTQTVEEVVGAEDTDTPLFSDITAPEFEWPQGQPLFETNWEAVTTGLRGNGVIAKDHLEVNATPTPLEISVALGEVYFEGTTYRLTSAEKHTLSAGDGTNDRWDTIYFDSSTGASAVREGTPAVQPEPPETNDNELLLAVVYVEANATNVSDSEILNWRSPALTASNIQGVDTQEFSPSVSGVAEGAAAVNVFSTGLKPGETLRVEQATFIEGDGTAAPTGLDFVLGVLDGTGGESKVGEILTGDGSEIHRDEIGNPLASYTNTSGSEETIAL